MVATDRGMVDARARLCDEIAASAKYRGLCRETIEDIVARELQAGADLKLVRQRARKRLHEVAALYLGTPRLTAAKRALDQAFAAGSTRAVQDACRELLGVHASTRERLPLLPEFYQRIFERTGTPAVVADLAAALGPLCYRFMDLPPATQYRAYDIQRDFVELVAHYFKLERIEASVEHRDILVSPPEDHADVALLLKMYHCLEKRRGGAGLEVLERARARHVVISLPTHTIGGRRAPFVRAYFDTIEAAAARAGWDVQDDGLDGECYLIVHKPELHTP